MVDTENKNNGLGEQEQEEKNVEYSIEAAVAQANKQNGVCRFYGQTNIPWHS